MLAVVAGIASRVALRRERVCVVVVVVLDTTLREQRRAGGMRVSADR